MEFNTLKAIAFNIKFKAAKKNFSEMPFLI